VSRSAERLKKRAFALLSSWNEKDERRRTTTRIECWGFYASQIPTFCACNLTRDHGIVDIQSFPDAKIPFLRTLALKNRFLLSLRSTQWTRERQISFCLPLLRRRRRLKNSRKFTRTLPAKYDKNATRRY